jgi:predicted nucleic acid-binding protein
MLLCDTGVLLAPGNIKDQAHRACVRLLREAEGPLMPTDGGGDLISLAGRVGAI